MTKTRKLIDAGYQAFLNGQPCEFPGKGELARGAWEQGWRAANNERGKMETINITPDFDALASTMLRASKASAESLMQDRLPEVFTLADRIRDVQAVLAPLNVAAHAIANGDMLVRFQNTLAGIVEDLHRRATELENEENELMNGDACVVCRQIRICQPHPHNAENPICAECLTRYHELQNEEEAK